MLICNLTLVSYKSFQTSLTYLGDPGVDQLIEYILKMYVFKYIISQVIRMRKMGRAQRAQREGRTSE